MANLKVGQSRGGSQGFMSRGNPPRENFRDHFNDHLVVKTKRVFNFISNWNKKFSGSNVYIPIEDFIYRVIKIIGNYDLLFQFAN